MANLKSLNQDLKDSTATRRYDVEETQRHPRQCAEDDCPLCRDAHPQAAPHCPVCRGMGFVHPVARLISTPEGDMAIPDFTRIKSCTAPGCLLDTIRGGSETQTYYASKGISKLQTLGNFVPVAGSKTSFESAKALLADTPDKPFLYIFGDMGCGKTHLCNGVALSLSQQGRKAKLWRIDALLDWLREGVGNDSLFARTTELKNLDALVIDDFESAKLVADKGKWALEKMEEVIDHRYHARLITMITSNDNYDKLPEKILDRFNDKSVAVMVWNEAGNYRRQTRK